MTSVPDAGVQRTDRPRSDAGVTSTNHVFEVVGNVKDACAVVASVTGVAIRAARELPVGKPSREVSVVFDTLSQRSQVDDIAQIAREAQIHAHLGHQVFPDLPLDDNPTRMNDCASWIASDKPYERGFAIDKHGSLAAIERIGEYAGYMTRYRVSGVGILACLRPLIGAVLFARAATAWHGNRGRAWVVLKLRLAPDTHLVIDPAGQLPRDPQQDKFVATACDIQEGGWFDPRMDIESVEAFLLKIMARLAYRFGFENCRQMIQAEIHRLLGLYRVPAISLAPPKVNSSRRTRLK
jgi:hypothetical protein